PPCCGRTCCRDASPGPAEHGAFLIDVNAALPFGFSAAAPQSLIADREPASPLQASAVSDDKRSASDAPDANECAAPALHSLATCACRARLGLAWVSLPV